MEKTVYEKWNNIVIENHSSEMGKKIIEWWKSKGVSVETNWSGETFKMHPHSDGYFYGIIKNQFGNFSEKKAKEANARILQWSEVEAFEKMKENPLYSMEESLKVLSYEPEKEWIPEYGKKVLVWENENSKLEYYFHSKTNGLFWVFQSDSLFLNGDYDKCFILLAYKNCKPLPKEVWLTAEEISQGKGVGVDPKLIRFKELNEL